MPRSSALRFYQFSAAHALLIGLLPFYLPALLWQAGQSLADIAVFIAIGGFSYAACLLAWDALRARHAFPVLVVPSFVLWLAVVAATVFDPEFATTPLTAALYGAYGCFYWMTQRLLFVECTGPDNTGRRFGNAQILVTVLLKVGILCGGFLWDRAGAGSVLTVAVVLGLVTTVASLRLSWPTHTRVPASRPRDLVGFSDRHRSRAVFLVDGVFLFAESFFWVITLYALADQNIANLGVLVVVLSAVLSVVFYLIKNRLDTAPPHRIYVLAVLGYAASWGLRGAVDLAGGATWSYVVIVLIAFLTALFRLVFNKRFFDVARLEQPHAYIVAKSQWSQLALGVGYLACALTVFGGLSPTWALPLFYALLVPLTGVYLRYRAAL